MSYEPTLIIRKSDLEKNRKLLEYAEFEIWPKLVFKGKDGINKKVGIIHAYQELLSSLNIATVNFPELEFVIIHPEGTLHGCNVRDLMDELKIDYRINN